MNAKQITALGNQAWAHMMRGIPAAKSIELSILEGVFQRTLDRLDGDDRLALTRSVACRVIAREAEERERTRQITVDKEWKRHNRNRLEPELDLDLADDGPEFSRDDVLNLGRIRREASMRVEQGTRHKLGATKGTKVWIILLALAMTGHCNGALLNLACGIRSRS